MSGGEKRERDGEGEKRNTQRIKRGRNERQTKRRKRERERERERGNKQKDRDDMVTKRWREAHIEGELSSPKSRDENKHISIKSSQCLLPSSISP